MNEERNSGRVFLDLGYITKVNINALNSSDNLGGNVVIIKKFQDSKGNYYVYVSGQAFRYYLKYSLMQLGMELTKIDKSGEIIIDKRAPTEIKERMKYIIKNHPDLDLFGFMEAKTKSQQAALRRWSPVKVSPLINIFPWRNETDLLTRKKEGQEGGDLVKVEVNALNYMRGTTIINVNEVGSYIDELNLELEDVIGNEERNKRIELLLEAFKNLSGGGKIARLLDDITPKFLIIAKQKAGTPIFLNSLMVDEEGNIKIELIKESLEEYEDMVEDCIIGIRSGIFANENEIRNSFKENNGKDVKVVSISEAIDTAKKWISSNTKNNSEKTSN